MVLGLHKETTFGGKLNKLTVLEEVKFDVCGGVTTVSDAGSRPIKVPANGHGYVRSSKLEENGKFSRYPRAYKVSIGGEDTGIILRSEEVKKHGRIVFKKYENGKLTIVFYPVSEFNIKMLRIFRTLRGNEYPRGPGKEVVRTR